jgi:alpha-1,2-mannosyltransferase
VSTGPGSADVRGEAAPCGGSAWVMRAGVLALGVSLGLYAVNLALHLHVLLSDVDLAVYRDAGLVARHSPGQLYEWRQSSGLRFTYTPFAAVLCIDVSVLPWGLAAGLMLAGSVAALLATVWLAFCGLGWHGTSRLGAACAVSAVALWLEPVQRTLHTGEIDLLLMLLVFRDLSSSGRRWRGAGVGAAAGIKLVALIFIPYLLLTGRYREAATAVGTFAATVVTGAVLLPQASATWWLGGAFLNARRTGFVGFLANQSLLGMTTRFAGAVPPAAVWLVLSALAGGLGLLLAAAMHRGGRPVHGWVVCAVTGLIVSPVSWDHHWVWIAPALAVLADMAIRGHGAVRAAWTASAGLVAVVFGAWPSLWKGGGSAVPWGLIWYAPYTRDGTGGIHPEYHWAGLQLLAGNLYLLAGFVMLATAAAAAATGRPRPRARIARSSVRTSAWPSPPEGR